MDKTSDHVLGIRPYCWGGDILDTQSMPVELARTLGENTTTPGRIYQTVLSVLPGKPSTYPSIAFQSSIASLTGYDLRHVFNDDMTRFDLTRILTGRRDAGVYY
ncbi:FAD-binding protein [Salmonella enterica subsp. enterica]|uniref:FAD-binding protein n=1 Tax=Salmonella enterica I TaxID=59201 RepID=A0A3S4FUA1_SALET|nr:FAD-binding protein [Salmonella enterica subsp. enterica]